MRQALTERAREAPSGVRFRRSAVLVVAATVAGMLLATAASAGDGGAVFDPRCRITLTPARESHADHYSIRCNFEQSSSRIASDSRIVYVDPSPRLSGDVDPGDGVRCRLQSRFVAGCEGSAGSDARVGGYFETKEFSCDLAIRFRITGVVDCPPDAVCPAIAFAFRKSFEPRPNCA